MYFQILLKDFVRNVHLEDGCLSKYRRAFIVYMFLRPPEMWSLVSDNAFISGTSKVGIACHHLEAVQRPYLMQVVS